MIVVALFIVLLTACFVAPLLPDRRDLDDRDRRGWWPGAPRHR
jgi:hypothetical protein